MVGKSGDKANSAFYQVEVEVESELGKNKLIIFMEVGIPPPTLPFVKKFHQHHLFPKFYLIYS